MSSAIRITPSTLLCTSPSPSPSPNGVRHAHLAFPLRIKPPLLKLTSTASSSSSPIVCLSNSNSNSNSEGASSPPPWKAFEKALGNITGGQSVEQVLKQQMENQQFSSADGGSGGGGSGGGSGDGPYGADDDSFGAFFEETLQVLLASAAFIFLYIYIITGEELLKLVRDYVVYLFKGTETTRLKQVMDKWRRYWRSWKVQRVEESPYWLEEAIMSTRTSYDDPENYGYVANDAPTESDSDSDSDSDSVNNYNNDDDDRPQSTDYMRNDYEDSEY